VARRERGVSPCYHSLLCALRGAALLVQDLAGGAHEFSALRAREEQTQLTAPAEAVAHSSPSCGSSAGAAVAGATAAAATFA
jgi:hypothetical protein